MSRCPWPVSTPTGVIQCVTTGAKCGHRQPPPVVSAVLNRLWRLKRYWPSELGRVWSDVPEQHRRAVNNASADLHRAERRAIEAAEEARRG